MRAVTLPRRWLPVALALLSLGGVVAPRAAPGQVALTPVLARSVVVSALSGTVLVKPRGLRRFTRLTHPLRIPVGSAVDATRGRVRVLAAAAVPGRTQSGEFSGGAFVIVQARSALTDLRLIGGRSRTSVCGPARSARVAPATSSRIARRALRLLQARASGSFRTIGQYSAATVRGTSWETVDRCDGTLTVDRTGIVRSTTGELVFDLKPGQSAIGYCFPPSGTPQTREFCIVVVSEPANGIFGFGIGLRRPDAAYDLCIRAPSGIKRCRHFALAAPNTTGVRVSAVVCEQDEGVGQYMTQWFVAGRPLGIPLIFTATIRHPLIPEPCIHQP